MAMGLAMPPPRSRQASTGPGRRRDRPKPTRPAKVARITGLSASLSRAERFPPGLNIRTPKVKAQR